MFVGRKRSHKQLILCTNDRILPNNVFRVLIQVSNEFQKMSHKNLHVLTFRIQERPNFADPQVTFKEQRSRFRSVGC